MQYLWELSGQAPSTSGTADIWSKTGLAGGDREGLEVMGEYPVISLRMFYSILGFYPLDTSGTYLLICDNEKCIKVLTNAHWGLSFS